MLNVYDLENGFIRKNVQKLFRVIWRASYDSEVAYQFACNGWDLLKKIKVNFENSDFQQHWWAIWVFAYPAQYSFEFIWWLPNSISLKGTASWHKIIGLEEQWFTWAEVLVFSIKGLRMLWCPREGKNEMSRDQDFMSYVRIDKKLWIPRVGVNAVSLDISSDLIQPSNGGVTKGARSPLTRTKILFFLSFSLK